MKRFVFFDVSLENLGVQILAALLDQHDYDCRIVYEPIDHINASEEDFTDQRAEQLSKEIISHQPDAIGFSTVTDTYQFCCKIAQKIKEKEPEKTIIFGGCHATVMGGEILKNPYIDFVIVGEAEIALIHFLEEFYHEKRYDRVNNLCYRRDQNIVVNPLNPYLSTSELDRLPFPNKQVYFEKNMYARLRYLITTSRGCTFKCTYCANNVLKKVYHFENRHIRRRSPENVITELEFAKMNYNIRSVWFMDDVFTSDRKWLREFVSMYEKRIRLPAECTTHPVFITNEIGDLLERMNVVIAHIGIQTADEIYRKEVLKRFETNKKVENAVNILRNRKIEVTLDHILGLPNESEESIVDSIDTYSKWHPSLVGVFSLTYYPKTEIVDVAKSMGILNEKQIEDINEGRSITSAASSEKININFSHHYLRYAILFRSIGFIPGFIVRFFSCRTNWVPPSKFLYFVVSLYPRFMLQLRRGGTFALIRFLLKNRFKNNHFLQFNKRIP